MPETKKPKFKRRSVDRYSKLGLRRKKKQIWRRPTGRDNKMREKRRGYPAVVSVGYQTDNKVKGTINEKKPVMIMNVKDLEKVGKDNIAVIGKIGNKKKTEVLKVAKEKKIEIANVNSNKFLKKVARVKKFKDKKKQEAKTAKEKKQDKKDEKKMEKTEKKNSEDKNSEEERK